MKSDTKLIIPVHLSEVSEWDRYFAHLSTIAFDGIEWRLDALSVWDFEKIKNSVIRIRNQFPKQLLILTLRTEGEQEDPLYIKKIEQLAPLADIVDIEYYTVKNKAWIESIEEITPVILSVHQFEASDHSMGPLFEQLSKIKVSHLKIATTCQTERGIQQVLQDTVEAINRYPQTISTMVMGQEGVLTRTIAPSLKEGFVYAGLGTCCLRYGQLPAEMLIPYVQTARRNHNG